MKAKTILMLITLALAGLIVERFLPTEKILGVRACNQPMRQPKGTPGMEAEPLRLLRLPHRPLPRSPPIRTEEPPTIEIPPRGSR